MICSKCGEYTYSDEPTKVNPDWAKSLARLIWDKYINTKEIIALEDLERDILQSRGGK